MNVNNNNRNKIAGLAVVTILLITAMTVTILNQTVFAHKHHSKYNSDKLKKPKHWLRRITQEMASYQ